MSEPSLLRIYLMRAMYAFMATGLALTIWPGIVSHELSTPLMSGVVDALLGALGVLALLGIRYPVQMIPLLLFEFLWKAIWLIAYALPLQASGSLDPATTETIVACLMGVIPIPLILPWRYVIARYVTQRGNRWTRAAAA